MRALGRGIVVAVASLALGVVLLGLPTMLLQLPAVTSTLVARYYDPAAGLPLPVALRTAEQVRAYTTSADAPSLPAEVGGRPAFDEAAASHLRDVRRVLEGARALTLASAALLAALLAFAVPARACRSIALVLRTGALGTLALALAAGTWGALDFDGFFAAFHGVFFAAGTWTFPYGSLLIELFPEPLWAALGALWAAGVLAGAAAALVTAWSLVRRGRGLVGEEV